MMLVTRTARLTGIESGTRSHLNLSSLPGARRHPVAGFIHRQGCGDYLDALAGTELASKESRELCRARFILGTRFTDAHECRSSKKTIEGIPLGRAGTSDDVSARRRYLRPKSMDSSRERRSTSMEASMQREPFAKGPSRSITFVRDLHFSCRFPSPLPSPQERETCSPIIGKSAARDASRV